MAAIMRHYARQYAMQAIYQWQLVGTDAHELELQFRNCYINKDIDMAYFHTLLHGVITTSNIATPIIMAIAKPSDSTIEVIDMAILRIAYYELACHPELPHQIIINESVGLAKRFSGPGSYKFINAIIEKLVHIARTAAR